MRVWAKIDPQQGGVGLQIHRSAVRRFGLRRPAGLEQHLALELPKIGIGGLLGDQGVDGRQGLGGFGFLVIGDGAGVAGGKRLIGFGIFDQGRARAVEEPLQLGLHHSVPRDRLGSVDGADVRLLIDPRRQGLDAIVGEGVIAEEGELLLVVEHFLVSEIIEEIDQAPARHAGPLEIGDRRLIRPRLLLARIAEGRDLGEIAGRIDQRRRALG